MKKRSIKKNDGVTVPIMKLAIRDAVDELAAMTGRQFTRINERFDGIEGVMSGMATKVELRMEIDALYQTMTRRFDTVDARFERVDERFDSLDNKIDTFILFMRGHEKRIDRIEKHLELA